MICSTNHCTERYGINIDMIIHNRLIRICRSPLKLHRGNKCLRLDEITFHPSFWRIECSNMIIMKLCMRSSMSPKLVELEFLLAAICKNNKVRIFNKRIIAYWHILNKQDHTSPQKTNTFLP